MIKILMNNGPWGPWSGSGEGQDKKSDQKEEVKNDGSFDDFIKKSEETLKKFLNEGGNGGKNRNGGSGKMGGKTPKSLIGIIALGAILLWLATGFYKVNPNENAIVLYFGKFYAISTPGLNYRIPYPFGKVIKKSVTSVNTEEFGFSSSGRKKYDNRDFEAESLMLTGDENIVDIEFQVQWQIADIKNFVFNIAEPNQAIRKAAEASMREIIARTPIADALSDGKKKIEQGTKELLQQILDSYGAGVRVVLVQLLRVDPPSQVINSFRDVQTAKADKEKEINESQSYSNDVIPRARGTAAQMKEQAEAYAKEAVSHAHGEAGKFLTVYQQYIKSKEVTKKRIYIETMEKIYRDMNKVFIDKSAAKNGVIPYFPVNEIPQKQNKE